MRVIVAHPEQQHSYRLAGALKEAGCLEKYITTVYKKDYNLTSIVAHILPKKYAARAMTRHCSELENSEVVQFCEGLGLLKLFSSYFLKKHYQKLRCYTADRFAHKVADYAIKHQVDAVVTYDNCSPVLFRELSEKAPHILRIMDMSAANLFYMKEIYERDFKLAPKFAGRLRKERSYIWDDAYMERIRQEQKYTQYYLTPSEFVQRSLAHSGVQEEQMLMCPYGVDTTQFSMKEYHEGQNLPLKIVYIGGIKELKGVYYLLEAFKGISPDIGTLTIVGDYDDSEDIKEYAPYVTFTGRIPHSEMQNVLKAADAFIFPSLGEGMSLSILEAAACGLPLIISDNCGFKEKVGEEGIIFDIQSIKAIQDKVKYLYGHQELIPAMGIKARKMAERYTWENYRVKVKEIFKSFD